MTIRYFDHKLAGLGAGLTYAFNPVENVVGLGDLLFQGRIATGVTSAKKPSVDFYLLGSLDGQNWPCGYGGKTGLLDVVPPDDLRFYSLPVSSSAVQTTPVLAPSRLLATLGGVLPPWWTIALVNRSGGPLGDNEDLFVFPFVVVR